MRDALVKQITACAQENSNIILITGDLGFGVLDNFIKSVPRQFINAGIAEQNMTGVATGLALAGKIVFTYSIGNFPTLRCLEQIRNDVIYHNANVNIIAVGGGLSYGALGMSHHATEDIAIMRALPSLRIYAPCDIVEVCAIAEHIINFPSPTYLRIDKSKVNDCSQVPFNMGTIRELRSGSDVVILAYGGIVEEGLRAAQCLSAFGIDCGVYSAPCIKPFDYESLLMLLQNSPLLVTLEEHLPTGGLGSLVSEFVVDNRIDGCRILKIALPNTYSSIVGTQEYLRQRLGVDSDAIVNRIRIELS